MLTFLFRMHEKKKISKLKTGVVSRGLSLAKIGLGAGLKYAVNRATSGNLDSFLTDQAKTLSHELSQLKGSAMKAGQMLSVFGEHFLPPEANAFLKTLQSDSHQVEWTVIREQLQKELSPDLLEELEIDELPMGSASMGQVHPAVIKATGEKIALKIQYPGVDTAIDSDVAAIKRILNLSRILPQDIDTKPLFDEIRTMLEQELDYTIEAAHTRRYRELVGTDSRFKVPKVFDRYSTKRVLATEYLEGLKVDHPLIQALSTSRRNRLAKNFLDLYFKELFIWETVQTDPHPGNYKIHIDSHGNDVLVLLDFGAVKQFDTNFMKNYRLLIKGAVLDADEIFTTGAKGLGFIVASDPPEYVEYFKKFCRDTVEPFKSASHESEYHWKENDLPARVMKSAFEFRKFKLRTPPRELVFLDRKTAGVFMFLGMLNAKFNGLELISPYLDSI